MVKDALDARSTGAAVDVPFTAIDLINGFNEWKKSETAGRMFVVDQQGVAEIGVTGLPWRYQVCQQVFEGGAVDCAVALDAWRDAPQAPRTSGWLSQIQAESERHTVVSVT